ncbi:aromatic ring-hydroxylating dioxygenase subunit alpha [Maribacter sp. MJ134]|uniref:aromatic ring-hydroxylating oxygenase subunit alpha n=1 Tax=Maribacter sp. MJ134 TaxID=2496865 RepID=UPI000F82289C|nr:SRPBCC family protein [Maribacter sp. MJ134]AZQ57394.1 aromatic ring-hydroxylating dioxygenase subunit alpha [Maribacter sp. MJ134]
MKKFRITKDIKNAETLPASFYRSTEVFELLKEKVFLNSWHWIGDMATIVPLSQTVYPLVLHEKFLDEPVLVIRDKDDVLHCVSNVCTHRGNLIVHHPGKQTALTCMYHGRRFHMNGNFKAMPEFEEAEDFPRACDDLHKFSIKTWLNHLFISLKPNYKFKEITKVLDERVGFLPVHNFKFDPTLSKDYIVNCHWALYCDNYLEGFHIPFVHADLNAALDYGSYTTEIFDYATLQIGYSGGGEEVFDLPEGHPDHGKSVAAYYYWVFPNMMFNFYPWGLSVNIVNPIANDKTKVQFLTYVYDETKLNAGAGALLDKVEREDEFVVEGVHKGLKSRFYSSGRFSPTQEKGVHHFHSLLAEHLNM